MRRLRVIRGGADGPPEAEGPLDQYEIETLNDSLFELTEGECDFDGLDGFCTAMALAPTLQMPARWYWSVFDAETEEETDSRVAAAEETGTLALLLRHWRTVVRRMETEEWTMSVTEPSFCASEAAWALGFLNGLDTVEHLWGPVPGHLEDNGPLASVHLAVERARLIEGKVPPAMSTEERAALAARMVAEVKQVYRDLRRVG